MSRKSNNNKKCDNDFNIQFHLNQRKIFFDSSSRYKIIAKGRRFGLTRGFANFAMYKALNNVTPILWVDTIYGNIERYYERYFLPALKSLPKRTYIYSKRNNQLYIYKSVIDFRSADRPENFEGFGYRLVFINEAGIVLKNRRLWTESILPMTIEYKASVYIGGTPKGKYTKKNERHLFYDLFLRGNQSNEKRENQENHSKNNGIVLWQASKNAVSNEAEYNREWESFNFSSYDNKMLDPKEIKEVENEIPVYLREQEIYGKFVEQNQVGLIKLEWWKFYDESQLDYEKANNPYKIIQSWDTAFKANEENDYSVCTTWVINKNGFYLIDMYRGHLEFPELKRKAEELYIKFKIDEVLIEDKASGQSLIQELQRETRMAVKRVKVDRDKTARLNSITPLLESGRIKLPDKYDFNEVIINEFEEFPNGEFDDIIDSVTQAINENKENGAADYKIYTANITEIIRGKHVYTHSNNHPNYFRNNSRINWSNSKYGLGKNKKH